MPIILHPDLPAHAALRQEGYPVIDSTTGTRPATRLGLLNLMPDKLATEADFARVLCHTPTPVELVPLKLLSYQPRGANPEHLRRFYTDWQLVTDGGIDRLIITGAPVEHLRFNQVDYWPELVRIFDWIRADNLPALLVCWAAQAALHHYYNLPKVTLAEKRFGVFEQEVVQRDPLLRGLDTGYLQPVSRHTEVPRAAIAATEELRIISQSVASGVDLARDITAPRSYLFNHPEYAAQRLGDEYQRDAAAGRDNVPLPVNYYPADNPARRPRARWHAAAKHFYSNWLLHGSRPAKPSLPHIRAIEGATLQVELA